MRGARAESGTIEPLRAPAHRPGLPASPGCAGAWSRRRALGALALAAVLPRESLAMWAQMSDAELVQHSDLVVIGEWVGQSSVTLPGEAGPLELGGIAVAEVLKGPAGQTLALVVTTRADTPRSSTDLIYRRGDRGLWLLRRQPGGRAGLYLADHPQRFVSAAGGAARIEALRRLLPRP